MMAHLARPSLASINIRASTMPPPLCKYKRATAGCLPTQLRVLKGCSVLQLNYVRQPSATFQMPHLRPVIHPTGASSIQALPRSAKMSLIDVRAVGTPSYHSRTLRMRLRRLHLHVRRERRPTQAPTLGAQLAR